MKTHKQAQNRKINAVDACSVVFLHLICFFLQHNNILGIFLVFTVFWVSQFHWAAIKELCHEIQPNYVITKCPLNWEKRKNNRLKL